MLESVARIKQQYEPALKWFEIFSVVVFSIEYFLRILCANVNPKYRQLVTGNLRFATTPLAIIDLLAILPFYLPFVGIDLRFIRALRIFRLFRIFKIARYLRALDLIKDVVKSKREELIISLVFTLFLLLISSTVMYYVEHDAQPEHFSSIPQTMWWGIATLTTVGYGDLFPITAIGKILGGIIAIIGIGLFALPTGILASGFSDELSRRKVKEKCCPACGRELEIKHHHYV
jgi:voltage-gated potassium channel